MVVIVTLVAFYLSPQRVKDDAVLKLTDFLREVRDFFQKKGG